MLGNCQRDEGEQDRLEFCRTELTIGFFDEPLMMVKLIEIVFWYAKYFLCNLDFSRLSLNCFEQLSYIRAIIVCMWACSPEL